MPAPDSDPLCPRKATVLRGVGNEETDQTKACACIRRKLHLALKFTVTGSPIKSRLPHVLDLYSPALGSPSDSLKEPSTKCPWKPCSPLPTATLQTASELPLVQFLHSYVLVTHTTHTSLAPHRNCCFLYSFPKKHLVRNFLELDFLTRPGPDAVCSPKAGI
jgi:hypothetical protein